MILSYQNLAIQHENLHNYTQALLFYQISENLKSKKDNYSSDISLPLKTDSENAKDALYKFKLIKKVKNEKSEYIDKIGSHFFRL